MPRSAVSGSTVVTLQRSQRLTQFKEPLRTLTQYRKEDGKVWFGMNLIHDHSGELAVGDDVTSPSIVTGSGP